MIQINQFLLITGEIYFDDGVNSAANGCSKNPPPTTWNKVCQNFMNTTGYKFKDHTDPDKEEGRSGIDEVHLITISEGEAK